MPILEELLQPLTLKSFKEDHLSKTPFAAPFRANRFKNLVSWNLIEEILSTGHSNCWLPKEGQLPEDPTLSNGKITIQQARQAFASGRTLLIRHAELAHPKVFSIAEDFFQVFHSPIDIQIYCTPGENQGFDWHYDIEEVFVIQCQSEKEFRLKQNTINPNPNYMPKDLGFEKESTKTEIHCLLKAGDWLYIPSGYCHKAKALTDSFHISVGILKNKRDITAIQ